MEMHIDFLFPWFTLRAFVILWSSSLFDIQIYACRHNLSSIFTWRFISGLYLFVCTHTFGFCSMFNWRFAPFHWFHYHNMVESKIARSYVNESENTWINGFEFRTNRASHWLWIVCVFVRSHWMVLPQCYIAWTTLSHGKSSNRWPV